MCRLLYWIYCSIISFVLASSVHGATDLRAKLKLSSVSGCVVFSKMPDPPLGEISPALQTLVKKFEDHILYEREGQFKSLFHPKAKVGSNIGQRILAPLRGKYKKPWDVSVSRVFILNQPKEEKTPVVCEEDQITLTPIYGYSVQVGVWLQLMAQNELGRIYLSVVPKDDEWFIAGLHVQQWSFQGQAFEAWLKKALEARDAVAKHMNLDVAQKLLYGGQFIEYRASQELLKARNDALSKPAWLELARKSLQIDDLVYIGTALADDGLGIVIRRRTPKALSLEEFRQGCHSTGQSLLKLGWLKEEGGGVKCEFILPRESDQKEGILGSQYLSLSELHKES